MKNIVIIKSHPCVQLAHLYEHLFVMAVKDYFYQNNLYKLSDYALNGTTYEQGGIIEINCELYSSKAMEIAENIMAIKIDFGKDNKNVTHALLQMTAEEQNKLYVTDKQLLLAELRTLDATTWRNVEALSFIDTKGHRRKTPPIYLTDTKQPAPRKLKLHLTLDGDFASTHRTLLPLFNIAARFLALTLTDVITKEYGYYAGELYGAQPVPSMTSELLVAPRIANNVDLGLIAGHTKEILEQMTSAPVLEAFADTLSSISYTTGSPEAPNLERIMHETGIYIGTAGWQETATTRNLWQVLGKMDLELTFGHRRRSFSLYAQ